MSTHDGGPAFPRPYSVEVDGGAMWAQDGMSLRDYFAGQALAGLLAASNDPIANHCAELAYRAADQMLRARDAR